MDGRGGGRPGRARRGARREVFVGLTVFLLVQAAVALLVEAWYPAWRRPLAGSRVEHYVRRAAEPGRPRTVVFLGSSRFAHGVRRDVLEPLLSDALASPVAVFNYSEAGGGPLSSRRQWHNLRKAGARPDLVVVDVVPSLLNEEVGLNDLPLECAPAGELEWDEIGPLVERDPARADLYRENLVARAVPTYGHRLAITGRVLRTLHPEKHQRRPDPFLDVETDPPLAKHAAALEYARREHGAVATFRPGRAPLAAVEGLLAELARDGVPRAAVVTPEGPTFRSWYRAGAWEEIESALRDVCARTGTTLIVARDWFGDDAFFDAHHLTVAGGQRFSYRLGGEFLVSLLRGTELTRR